MRSIAVIAALFLVAADTGAQSQLAPVVTAAQSIVAQEEPAPIKPIAMISSGHEQMDTAGNVLDERTPFEVWERIKLDASGSTGGVKYLWGVFVDFDVRPEDMEGKAPAEVIDAVRKVESYGGSASLPTHDSSGIVQEYDGGTILDILPVPGTYYVTLTAIADNDGHQVQAIIHVKPYPGTTPPDDPDPPVSSIDFSEDVREWLETVPGTARVRLSELADLCLSFKDDTNITARAIADAKFGVGAALALGNDGDTIAAWKPFFDAMSEEFAGIPASVGIAEYRAAYVSVGTGLQKWK